MIDQESMLKAGVPQYVRDAVDEFFTFAEEEGVSYWDRRDWKVKRWSKSVDTLFFKPLFCGHERGEFKSEFHMAEDFLKVKTENARLQVGFFTATGKNLVTREELRASREGVETTDEKNVEEIDYANLKELVSINSIFSKDEENG